MKKHIMILAAASLIALSGCAEKPADTPAEPTVPEDEALKSICHTPGEAPDAAGFRVTGEYMYDFDSDGEEDTLELWTAATASDGEEHEDDGERQRVTVTTAEGVFVLFDEYVQLGDISLDVGELYNDEAEKIVILTMTTGAGKSIRHYTFSDGAFYEELVYSTDSFAEGGANLIASIE